MTQIHLIFMISLASFATSQAGRMLLALYALDLGAQPLAVGVLAATFSALPMLLSWQVGRLADRLGSRWLLIIGAAGGSLGMLVPWLVPALPSMYAAAALLGLSFTFYTVTLQNLVGLESAPEQRAKNFSTFSMVASIAGFLGPLISGFSIDHFGLSRACLVVVLLAVFPIIILAVRGRMLRDGGKATGKAEKLGGILSDPTVRHVLVISSLVQFGLDLFQFYMPIYAHSLGLSATVTGLILAMFSAAAFVVRTVLPWMLTRVPEKAVLAYAFFLGALCFILLPLFKSAAMLMLIAFLFGVGMGAGAPITMMLTFAQSSEGRSGEALGLRMTVNHLSRVVGPLVFGSIATALGLLPVFWLNAAMLASGCVLARRLKAKPESARRDGGKSEAPAKPPKQ